jgi:hypothetical protein
MGRLEIRAVIYVDGISTDSIEIGITPADWAKNREAIAGAISTNGIFFWATFLYTRKIYSSQIAIIIKDGRGSVVGPLGFPGSYEARVKVVP